MPLHFVPMYICTVCLSSTHVHQLYFMVLQYVFTCLLCRDLALGLIAGNGGSGVEYNTNYSVFSIGLSLTVSVWGVCTVYGQAHVCV